MKCTMFTPLPLLVHHSIERSRRTAQGGAGATGHADLQMTLGFTRTSCLSHNGGCWERFPLLEMEESTLAKAVRRISGGLTRSEIEASLTDLEDASRDNPATARPAANFYLIEYKLHIPVRFAKSHPTTSRRETVPFARQCS
jgi:hypothetical protein